MSWKEVFRAKASIYALDDHTKQWTERGTSGVCLMYWNNQHQEDVRIKWEKNGQEKWWRLMASKLKPKGERAVVLKAWASSLNKQEILAIRFGDRKSAIRFSQKYHNIFPPMQVQVPPVIQHLQDVVSQDKSQAAAQVQQVQSMMPSSLNANISLAVDDDDDDGIGDILNDVPNPAYDQLFMQRSYEQRDINLPQEQFASSYGRAFDNYSPFGQPHTANVLNQPLPTTNGDLPFANFDFMGVTPNANANDTDIGGGIGGRRPPKPKWRCAVCTYLNDISKIRCTMCGLPKNKERSQKKGSPNNTKKWNCHKCTFGNPLDSDRCGVCSAKRVEFDSWECTTCTLLNRNETDRCHACNTPRPRSSLIGANPLIGNSFDWGQQSRYGVMNQEQVQQEMQRMRYQQSQNHRKKLASTEADFKRAASDIACYNNDPSSIFLTLRSVAKKLLKSEIRYRTLDTTNPKVMERLIGFEGVLDFLILLGFESDLMGAKLVAKDQPPESVVRNAINVLNQYQSRFRAPPTTKGMTLLFTPTSAGFGFVPDAERFPNKRNSNLNKHKSIVNKQLVGNSQAANRGNGDNNNQDSSSDGDDDLLRADKPTTIGFGDGQVDSANNKDGEDSLTIEQIILWATHETQNNETMEVLILTHKTFTDSLSLLKLLRRRFFVPIPHEICKTQQQVKQFQTHIQKRIHLNVIKALRDWLKLHWETDFHGNKEMLSEFKSFIKEMGQYANSCPDYCSWVKPLNDTVKKEFMRYQQKGNKYHGRIGPLTKNLDHVVVPQKTNVGQLSAEILADQLTLMAFDTFSRISQRELLEQQWKNPNSEESAKAAPNVVGMIKLFNSLSVFVQIQILREKNLSSRAKAIRRVIRMGERFRELRNFNSLCAVFGALNSAPIHRLKLAWRRVPELPMKKFEEWAMIFCSNRNHRNLRNLIREFPGRPCIPHLGVFLHDLIFIDEGNMKYVEEDIFSPAAAAVKLAQKRKQDNKVDHKGKKMINFSKCVRIADRIKSIHLYQLQPYSVKANEVVQKLLLTEFTKLNGVTEDEIWDMSTEIKRTDQREAKSGIFSGRNNANNNDNGNNGGKNRKPSNLK